jgi:hypothetical protein
VVIAAAVAPIASSGTARARTMRAGSSGSSARRSCTRKAASSVTPTAMLSAERWVP